MKRNLAVLAVVFSISCVTIGRQIDMTVVDRLEIGVTTKEDAIRLLGPPSSTTVSDAAENAIKEAGPMTILTWTYAHATAVKAPEMTSVMLWFDSKGVLFRKTTSLGGDAQPAIDGQLTTGHDLFPATSAIRAMASS